MKVGIITYHWACNYGAVLQTYALQQYLINKGYNVEIINYKPFIYDLSLSAILFHPSKLKNYKIEIRNYIKEKRLQQFRKKYLKLSKRYSSYTQLEKENFDYDVVISGSDQVLSPWFTLTGEGGPTPTFFLSFVSQCQRIAYGASFGCLVYPDEACFYAKRWIQNFDRIGLRENSGFEILENLQYNKMLKVLVPDPILLYGKKIFSEINISHLGRHDYYCTYVLRSEIVITNTNVVYIDPKHSFLSMEKWIGMIAGSQGLITNSYHGMIVAILFHIPFVAIMEEGAWAGMNDRFYTLLKQISLTDRIVTNSDNIISEIKRPIDWDDVDNKIALFRKAGDSFLNFDI